VDDSIVRVMAGRELVLRRARGYAPLPIEIVAADARRLTLTPTLDKGVSTVEPPAGAAASKSVLAVGAHLKNTFGLSVGPQVFVSQHIGDLETDQAYEAFRRVIADFEKLYEATPAIIAADAHPDYLSTGFARDRVGQASTPAGSAGVPARRPELLTVQHHVAHVLSCMAENELEPPVLGVAWDGTGYGLDGTVWGGEFFLVTDPDWQRFAHLRQFHLPGGDKAVQEPRRTALGLLFALSGANALTMTELPSLRAFSPGELANLEVMLSRGVNSPLTSSVGRLFDAVASLAGLRQQVRFEGQAAMELEFALDGVGISEAHLLQISPQSESKPQLPSPLTGHQSPSTIHASPRTHHVPYLLDWSPMVAGILDDLRRKVPAAQISAKFHNGLVESILSVARLAGQERVVLSGGCFQNRYLTERTIQRLREEAFRPYWHQRVPPNDGGISLGQISAALNFRSIDS
jgi:hydrogenase maturation protein HypF